MSSVRVEKILLDPKKSLQLRALSHDIRLTLLYLIFREGPIKPSEIQEYIDIPSNKLAYHLGVLKDAGLVINRYVKRSKEGYSEYSCTDDAKRYLAALGVKAKTKETVAKKPKK